MDFKQAQTLLDLRQQRNADSIQADLFQRGFLTLDGKKPEYAKVYGAQQTSTYRYPQRTELNVKSTDATIWFGENKWSAGKQCTFKFIKIHKKLYLDLDIKKLPDSNIIIKWIRDNNITKLNIAGNSEQTSKGIEDIVYKYLIDIFEGLSPIKTGINNRLN